MLHQKLFKDLVRSCKKCRYATTSAETRKEPEKSIIQNENRMKAWQLHSYGDDFQLTAARIPHIKHPDEILVNVEAASINPIDLAMKGGYGKTILSVLRGYELEFPLTLGRDFAGTIIGKGHGVGRDYQVGDKVYGIVPVQNQGSFAENLITNKKNVCMSFCSKYNANQI